MALAETAPPRLNCTQVAASIPVPSLMEDVRAGLLQPPRSLPPKYFYDETGSLLFERICATPEYYPARAESALLAEHADRIMTTARPEHLLELGSGSSRKTRLLLEAWGGDGSYWPFDVCEEMVCASGRALVMDYPWLTVRALVGDYHGGLAHLPLPDTGRRLIVFLGGTIGNFSGAEAATLLAEIAALMRPGDHLLIGADRVKPAAVLRAAYDDAEGFTARFNRNVLRVLNRELDADFPVTGYAHKAVYNDQAECIEMRLRAVQTHRVRLGRLGEEIEIAAGEEILTEISRKFTPAALAGLLADADLVEMEHFEADGGAYSLLLAARA